MFDIRDELRKTLGNCCVACKKSAVLETGFDIKLLARNLFGTNANSVEIGSTDLFLLSCRTCSNWTILQVSNMGCPPVEDRETTYRLTGGLDFFGAGVIPLEKYVSVSLEHRRQLHCMKQSHV